MGVLGDPKAIMCLILECTCEEGLVWVSHDHGIGGLG